MGGHDDVAPNRDCGALSWCPTGSDKRLFLGSILIVCIADAVVLAFVISYRIIHRRNHIQQLRSRNSFSSVADLVVSDTLSSSNDDVMTINSDARH
jgi:hypothetical protein